MDELTKKKFDQLQARLFLETGKKLSQQDLLGLLIDLNEKNREELLSNLYQSEFPLSKEQKQNILSLQFDLGYDTSKLDEMASKTISVTDDVYNFSKK